MDAHGQIRARGVGLEAMRTVEKDIAHSQQLRISRRPRPVPAPEPPELSAYGFKGSQYPLAARRVGTTPEQRFAWLIRFVNRPPEDFADPYLQEVREELFVFALGEVAPSSTFGFGLAYLTRERAKEIWIRTQTAMNSLLMDGEWKYDGPVGDRLKRMPDGSIAETLDQPFGADLWLWAIKGALCRHGRRLARCARWPKCEKIFLKHKAGLYCSSSCSHKVRNARRLHAVK
jgi:hypothetical protein